MGLFGYIVDVIRSGEFDPLVFLFILLGFAVIIFIALPFHELAHALVANKLGDGTARWNGRLSLNPMKHLDPIGTAMIVLIGFGYARPVPVNPRNFRNYKSGMALTALAGPVSNLLMAFLSLAIYRVVFLFLPPNSMFTLAINMFFWVMTSVNIGLAVFNLIPIPPLDGYRILSSALPPRWIYTIERYQMIITMLAFFLIFTGYLDTPINFVTNLFYDLFYTILRF